MRTLVLVFSLVLSTTAVAQAAPVLLKRPHLARAVPELDGSTAALALALVGGGLAMAHGRRRRRSA